jgi:hypothetical protein
MIGAFISHITNSSGVKRKKLLSVLLSSKMPSVIHQLCVLNRDMFKALILVIESDVPPNSTQELGNGLLASIEVSA